MNARLGLSDATENIVRISSCDAIREIGKVLEVYRIRSLFQIL